MAHRRIGYRSQWTLAICQAWNAALCLAHAPCIAEEEQKRPTLAVSG
jgi:hypothetical protein